MIVEQGMLVFQGIVRTNYQSERSLHSELGVLHRAKVSAHRGVDQLLAQTVVREDLEQAQVGQGGEVHGVLRDLEMGLDKNVKINECYTHLNK